MRPESLWTHGLKRCEPIQYYYIVEIYLEKLYDCICYVPLEFATE